MKEPDELKKPNEPQLPAKVDLDLDSLEIVKKAQIDASANVAAIGKQFAEAAKMPSSFIESIKSISRLNLDNLMPTMPDPTRDIKFVAPPPNPAYETNRLLREVSSKLDNLSEQNAKLVAPHFYPDNSEIIFANKRISIPKNTNQAQLCNALFSEPEKEWDWSEMLEAWGYDETAYKKDDWRKVYNTAREVNTKVAVETGVKDLLAVTQKTVQINPNYLAQIR